MAVLEALVGGPRALQASHYASDFQILLKQERFALSVDEINITKERLKEVECDVTL